MSDPFEVHLEGDARVVVRGELDMATAPWVADAITSAASTGRQRVVVDLADVSFMDSSGISALTIAHRTLEAEGSVLVLGPMSRQVRSALQIVGLESVFVVEPHDA